MNDKIIKRLYVDHKANTAFISINKTNNEAFLWLSLEALAAYIKVHRNSIIYRFKPNKKNQIPQYIHIKNHDIYLITDINTFTSIQEYIKEQPPTT